jgi:DNA-binding protein HU-beta
MNKRQFVEAVAARTGHSKQAAAEAVDAFFDTIRDQVAAGEKVVIPGFGSWERVQRPARDARNPATGATIHVPATFVPKFRAGASLKGAVKARSSA